MNTDTRYLLKSLAPAALATEPRKGLSDKYSFFPTTSLVDALEVDGWTVVEARQTGRNYNPYAKHQLVIADRHNSGIGEYPRVLLTNAHNGDASCKLQAGLWRLICSNGIVISDGFIQSASIRHSRHTVEEVVAAAQVLRSQAGRIAEHVLDFKEVDLSPAASVEFAKLALAQRLHNAPGASADPAAVLIPQRSDDAGQDLWRVFNRVQERLLKGQFSLVTKRGQTRNARPIKSIDESGRLNTALWELAEQFAAANGRI